MGMMPHSRIAEVVTIEINGLPMLKNVFYVNLKANLISVGQLCDNELMVMFTKGACKVMKSDSSCVLRGSKSSDTLLA